MNHEGMPNGRAAWRSTRISVGRSKKYNGGERDGHQTWRKDGGIGRRGCVDGGIEGGKHRDR